MHTNIKSFNNIKIFKTTILFTPIVCRNAYFIFYVNISSKQKQGKASKLCMLGKALKPHLVGLQRAHWSRMFAIPAVQLPVPRSGGSQQPVTQA